MRQAGNRGRGTWTTDQSDGIQAGRPLPAMYRQCAIGYTDFQDVYTAVLPAKCHYTVGKESGQTNYIERFNNTLRQGCSRLVRKTLSFSKMLMNLLGAIWYYIHDHTARQRAKLTITTSA